MYLSLMYLIPVTHFLDDVPTSDVSKSVTSYIDAVLRPLTFLLRLRVKNMDDAVDSLPVIVKVECFP